MSDPLEPEVVKSATPGEPVKPRRAQVRYKIRNLPTAVHLELDARLGAENYGSFEELSQWLERDHAQYISPSSLHNYYRNNFDPILRAVKIATAQAAEIVRVTGGDDDEMSGALFRLIQTSIFDLLVQLNKTRHLVAKIPLAQERSAAILATRSANHTNDGEPQDENAAEHGVLAAKFDNKVELAAISALGRTTAIVSKAQIEARRWREHVRDRLNEKVAATTAKVSEAARQGGMSPEVEEKIRSMLMEIKI